MELFGLSEAVSIVVLILIILGVLLVAAAALAFWRWRYVRSREQRLRQQDEEEQYLLARERSIREREYATQPDTRRSAVGLIPITDLQLGDQLGTGGFGTVYLARWRGTRVAVKRFRDTQNFEKELHSLMYLRHPHIVQYLGGVVDNGVNYIVTEFMEGGSLMDYINDRSAQTLEQSLRIALNISMGINYLHWSHKPPLIHADLKPENILLTSERVAKLADFGNTMEQKDGTMNGLHGTAPFLAPEQFHPVYTAPNRTTDIYSLGFILYMLFMQVPPHPIEPEESDGINNKNEYYEWLRKKKHQETTLPPKTKLSTGDFVGRHTYPRSFVMMLLACLQTDPRQRYLSGQVCRVIQQCLDRVYSKKN